MDFEIAKPWRALGGNDADAAVGVITYLRLDQPEHAALFQELSTDVLQQVEDAPGIVGFTTARSAAGAYLALSAWKHHDALRAFVDHGAHGRALGVFTTVGTVAVRTFEITPSDVPLEFEDAVPRLPATLT